MGQQKFQGQRKTRLYTRSWKTWRFRFQRERTGPPNHNQGSQPSEMVRCKRIQDISLSLCRRNNGSGWSVWHHDYRWSSRCWHRVCTNNPPFLVLYISMNFLPHTPLSYVKHFMFALKQLKSSHWQVLLLEIWRVSFTRSSFFLLSSVSWSLQQSFVFVTMLMTNTCYRDQWMNWEPPSSSYISLLYPLFQIHLLEHC